MRSLRLRSIGFVLLCGLLTALTATADSGEKLRRMLAAVDYQERNRLYLELRKEVRPPDLKALAAALDAPDPTAGGYYVIYLMEVADAKGALPHFRRALAHPLGLMRTYAAQALARQGDVSWADGFLQAIADPAAAAGDRLLLVGAFGALQEMPLLTRLVALIESLRTATPPDPQADVLGNRILATLSYRNLKVFLPEYRKALAAGGTQTRSAAAASLMRLGDASGLRVLREDYGAGRMTDNEMLTALGSLYGMAGATLTELLRAVLERSKLPALTLRAVQLLGDTGDRSAAGIVQEYAEDPDPALAEAALAALAKLETEDLAAFWKQRLAHESMKERIRAAGALIAVDRYEGLPVLAQVLRDRSLDPTVRKDAATALARAASADIVTPLFDGLEDPDPGVRAAVWTTLGKVLAALFPYRPPRVEDVGYDPAAAPATQRKAIDTLREFWARRGK